MTTSLHIQNHIRKYRFETGDMTQQELASKANVSRQTIIAIEKGQYLPSLELAFKLSIIFNISVNALFYVE